MAGFVSPFSPSETSWGRLQARILDDVCLACVRIDGLMGIMWPGFENAWIDYDEAIQTFL